MRAREQGEKYKAEGGGANGEATESETESEGMMLDEDQDAGPKDGSQLESHGTAS